MSEPEHDSEDVRPDRPSEDATADIEERHGNDDDEQGRPPADAPAY